MDAVIEARGTRVSVARSGGVAIATRTEAMDDARTPSNEFVAEPASKLAGAVGTFFSKKAPLTARLSITVITKQSTTLGPAPPRDYEAIDASARRRRAR